MARGDCAHVCAREWCDECVQRRGESPAGGESRPVISDIDEGLEYMVAATMKGYSYEGNYLILEVRGLVSDPWHISGRWMTNGLSNILRGLELP